MNRIVDSKGSITSICIAHDNGHAVRQHDASICTLFLVPPRRAFAMLLAIFLLIALGRTTVFAQNNPCANGGGDHWRTLSGFWYDRMNNGKNWSVMGMPPPAGGVACLNRRDEFGRGSTTTLNGNATLSYLLTGSLNKL